MTSPGSHPFMTYEFDTSTIDAGTWLALGEAMSKCQHLGGVPLKPAAAQEMLKVYLARGVQATTAIEGNTLSENEVRAIVDDGTADVGESREYLQREVQNVLGAVMEIDVALSAGVKLPITRDRLCELNYKVLDGIPDAPEVVPGKLREHDVTAGPYRPPHYTEVPEHVDRFVAWIEQLRAQISRESRPEDRFVNAVLAAVLAHLYIAWIHPFGNGNGRVARLVEVQILSESGIVPMVSTNLLSNHYNLTRTEYYRHLDLAQRDVAALVRYAVRGFLDQVRGQIGIVRRESMSIHWQSYVYDVFHSMPSTTTTSRRREVALALPENEVVTPEEMTELTTRLAKMYGALGERTPARDLNELSKMDLVERIGRRQYRVRREIIRAFLPPVSSKA